MFDYPDLSYKDVTTNELGKVKTIRVCTESIKHYSRKTTLMEALSTMKFSAEQERSYFTAVGLMAICTNPKTDKYIFDVDISPQVNADFYAKNHKDAKQSSDDEICNCKDCRKDRVELWQGEITNFVEKISSPLMSDLVLANQKVNPRNFGLDSTSTLETKKKST